MEKEAFDLNNNIDSTLGDDQENYDLNRMEKETKHETQYSEIINERENLYRKDIENEQDEKMRQKKEMDLVVLESHNKTVLDYANAIMNKIPDLSQGDKVATTIATMLHDSGKLISELKDHHIGSMERAQQILDEKKHHTIDNIEITDKLIEKILHGIERHMNHPFMQNVINGGNRYPDPETVVDKIVFIADLLANIGFKNVGFRLNTQKFLEIDKEVAEKEGTTILEQSFINVLYGKNSIKDVLNEIQRFDKNNEYNSKDTADSLFKIFEELKRKKIFEKIQTMFSENGEFSVETILKKGDGKFDFIKKLINEEIEKSGIEIGIDQKTINYFKI